MSVEFTSQQMLQKALELLATQYDVDLDSFFLVITKGVKDENPAVFGSQIVIGELETRAILTFIIHTLQQLSNTYSVSPYVFIIQHILGYFVREDNRLAGILEEETGGEFPTEDSPLGLENVDQEKTRTNALVYNEDMFDIEN